jgi:hypothetical protein
MACGAAANGRINRRRHAGAGSVKIFYQQSVDQLVFRGPVNLEDKRPPDKDSSSQRK